MSCDMRVPSAPLVTSQLRRSWQIFRDNLALKGPKGHEMTDLVLPINSISAKESQRILDKNFLLNQVLHDNECCSVHFHESRS
jgi:hypothetical protein